MSHHKHFPIRIPQYAQGIRAQELRAGVSRSWWAKKWMAAIEGMGLGSRLGRARNYAASGQTVELVIGTNPHAIEQSNNRTIKQSSSVRCEAKVLGARPQPYLVSFDFRCPTGEARERIVAAIRREPMFVARILADDLPTEIEEFFRAEGLTLFPGGPAEGERLYDTIIECSCPDYANPCKHSAAVLLLLGEEISRHPAALLRLRGIEIEELID